MKTLITLILVLALADGLGQNVYDKGVTALIKDSAIAYISIPINISFSPADLFTNISVASVKFTDGEKGIEFFIITRPIQKPPVTRPDSIILISSTDKILSFNRPYKDSIYFLSNHSLSITALHWLDNNELEILKQDLITAMIFIVDEKQIKISLSKKTQRKFKELILSSF